MSRYFALQTWVGSHDNEPDYNGQQCGERNVRSVPAVPLYDIFGNANTKAFSDEAIESRRNASKKAKVKKSTFDSICHADVRYARLEAQLEALQEDYETGAISLDDFKYAYRQHKIKMDRAWQQITKARQAVGQWQDEPEEDFPIDFTSFIERNTYDCTNTENSTENLLTDIVFTSNIATKTNELMLSLSNDNVFRKCWLFLVRIFK